MQNDDSGRIAESEGNSIKGPCDGRKVSRGSEFRREDRTCRHPQNAISRRGYSEKVFEYFVKSFVVLSTLTHAKAYQSAAMHCNEIELNRMELQFLLLSLMARFAESISRMDLGGYSRIMTSLMF